MKEKEVSQIHGISEGSIVRVTDIEGSDPEIVPQLQEGVTFEVRSIGESPGFGSKISVILDPVEGQGIDKWQSVIASTYEGWPNGCSKGLRFDADGHKTKFADKYVDLEVLE